ncbi:molybdopterin synthase [Natronosalvus vescus]|uniref:molybdopterin synthase n=1 Tax=Natronosalvus vescus TaxID=2953881 RepID=UPI0020900F49|nr:molybdopterin synthase [Natronosalvus vescus]
MYVLGIIDGGANDDRLERTADRIVDQLSRSGRVGVVRYDATIADGLNTLRDAGITPGGDVTYALGADGDWTASGTELTVADALDSLAPTCAYAVVIGLEIPGHPTVVVGDEREPSKSPVIATVGTPNNLDLEALATDLEATDPYRTLESLVERVKTRQDADQAGAIATFTGRVRAKDDPEDARTEYLEFEKYDGVADQRMAALQADLEAREGVYGVELYHRTGVVRNGEDIVHVVVLAGHREEAFRTVEDGINRLKDEVPLFKKEVTVEETFWVHDRS